MMKIKMLKNQSKPGAFPALPCYLAGQEYVLATEDEIAMGQQFWADGVAMKAVTPDDIKLGADLVEQHELQEAGKFLTYCDRPYRDVLKEGLAKMAEAGDVSLDVAVKAAETTLKDFGPKAPAKPKPKKK